MVALTPMNLPGINPCSYHSIFPLMLYEGKETREQLKEVLTPLNSEMDELKKPHNIDGYDGEFTCEFTCCADYFALVKLMRPAKDEVVNNKKSDSCTCAFCGDKRRTARGFPGWAKTIKEDVWETIPNEDLKSNILRGIPLKKFLFCILHLKVRIMGTFLKYLVRDTEKHKKCKQLTKALQAIVRTFNITLKGETLKSTGKKNTKQAKISAMQGGQVDKIMHCIRLHHKNQQPGADLTADELLSAQQWQQVLDSTGIEAEAEVLDAHTQTFQLFTQAYDLLNSTTDVTDAQLATYQKCVADLADVFVEDRGLVAVTPYLHILFKHSYAYLKEFRSLRQWSQEAFEASHKRHKQYYSKTNYGGGKNGDPSSSYLQVLQKLYRRQYLEQKIELARLEQEAWATKDRKGFIATHRARVVHRAKAARRSSKNKSRSRDGV